MNRPLWTGLTAALAIALLAVSIWGWQANRGEQAFRLMLENERQRSFFQMTGHVQEVSLLLGKAVIASSPRQVMLLLTDIRRLSEAAVEDLSRLPTTHTRLAETMKYLAQVGDFSATLAEQTARGEPLGDEQIRRLAELKNQLGKIQNEIQEISQQALAGDLQWVEEPGFSLARLRPGGGPGFGAGGRQPAERPLDQLEQQAEEFPTLLYDGPFADQTIDREPLGITGPEIDETEAERIARNWLPIAEADYTLTLAETTRDAIEAYSFRAVPENGSTPSYRADISKQGGHVIWWMADPMENSRPSTVITLDEGVRKAVDYLKGQGIADIEPIGRIRSGGDVYVALVKVENGVRLYPDLFKVDVSLETGDILGYDALTYLTNHHERRLNEHMPAYSMEEMASALNPRLYLLESRDTVIPLSDGSEVRAFEYRVQYEDELFLVYLNAETAEEERILRVIRTDDGEFTF